MKKQNLIKRLWAKFKALKWIAWIINLFSTNMYKPMKFKITSWFLGDYYFWKIKRRVIRAWRRTGVQYHVIPAGGDKVMLFSNKYREWYNKQPGVKALNIVDLLKMSYYSSPSGSRSFDVIDASYDKYLEEERVRKAKKRVARRKRNWKRITNLFTSTRSVKSTEASEE